MVQGKINRGRHTDHPAGRHSIQTSQCPPPPSPLELLQVVGQPGVTPEKKFQLDKTESSSSSGCSIMIGVVNVNHANFMVIL